VNDIDTHIPGRAAVRGAEELAAAVAVVYDAEDARVLLAEPTLPATVMALSPCARHALATGGYNGTVLTSRQGSRYRSLGTALTQSIRETEHVAERLRAADGISEAELWIFRYCVQAIAYNALRLERTLGDGPWRMRAASGGFEEIRDKRVAVAAMARRILARNQFFDGWHQHGTVPAPALFRILRCALLAALSRHRLKIVTQRSSHPYGLLTEIASAPANPTVCHVSPVQDGLKEYARLAREVVRASTGSRYVQIRGVPRGGYRKHAAEAVDAALGAVRDPCVGDALVVARDKLKDIVAQVMAYRRDIDPVLERLQPHAFFAFEHGDGYTAAAAACCGRLGVTRVIANHNSHTPAVRPADWPAMRYLFEMQYAPSLSDVLYVWHRKAEAVAHKILPQERHASVRRIHRPMPLADVQGGAGRTVLYAGNPHRWFNFLPWIYATTDEFADEIRELREACRGLDGVELVIRVKKTNAEIDLDVVRSQIGTSERVTLRTRFDVPFEQDLTGCDLLVCDMSTTIMQALAARKPVLLYGGGARYRHLPGRRQPPDAGGRAAVYVVDQAQDLPAMIASILKAHAGKPLTDTELEPYFFASEEAETMTEAANALCRGAATRSGLS